MTKKSSEKKAWKNNKKDNTENNIEEYKNNIEKLKQEKNEISEMAKRAQYDYINLKMDFDRLVKLTEEKEKNMQTDILIENIKKILPFVEELRKSLDTISKEQQETPLAKGLQLTYNKFLKTLEWINIFPIESLGLTPDSSIHEPVNIQPTEDKKLKWKIIQEFERWFIYKTNWETKVITTSKVVIWQ